LLTAEDQLGQLLAASVGELRDEPPSKSVVTGTSRPPGNDTQLSPGQPQYRPQE
jgi:hypothetical protein